MENNQVEKQLFNKVTIFIPWFISVIILATTFNAEIIGKNGFYLETLQSMLWVSLFSIIIGALFSTKKKGDQHIISCLGVASIFNALLIIGSLYNIFSK